MLKIDMDKFLVTVFLSAGESSKQIPLTIALSLKDSREEIQSYKKQYKQW